MEKKSKILIVILLASLFTGLTFVKAKYSVVAGQVYTYNVTESEWDYSFNEDMSEGTAFKFLGKRYSLDEQVTVTVDATDNTAIEYTINVGEESGEYYTTALATVGIYFLLNYPYWMVQCLEAHILDDAYLGVGLHDHFFTEPNIGNQMLALLADASYISSEYVNDDSMTYNHVAGVFDDDSDIVKFTWYYDTRKTVWTDETDFSGQYRLDIDYDQTTGVLQRYRIAYDYSGVWGFDSVAIKSIQEVRLDTYNPEGSPGFSWFITLSAITTLGLLGFVVKKRKR